jgi:hypothetical protein
MRSTISATQRLIPRDFGSIVRSASMLRIPALVIA